MMSFPTTMRFGEADLASWHHGWGEGWGHMLFGSAMMLVFWGAVVLLLVLLARWILKSRSATPSATSNDGSALDILERRFANGDIDQTEFEARRKQLSN